MLILALILAASQPAFIFKWWDKQGNLHVTDRLEKVPKELRERFQKMRDEATKGQKPTTPPPPEAVRNDNVANEAQRTSETGPSAYDRLKARMALERDVRKQADEARAKIAAMRAEQAALTEESGNLASNPVLNAAQPARVERMKDIEQELKRLDDQADEQLLVIVKLVEGAKKGGYPESWVTGY